MIKQEVRKADRTFENSVFINCSFDVTYKKNLIAILYTIITNNLNPVIAGDKIIGDINRNEVLVDLIKKSKYGIHDLSAVKRIPPGYNMPFEFGIFFGCKYYGEAKQGRKRFLIFEENRFDLKKVITDVSGIDPIAHNNNPYKIIDSLRNWFLSCGLKRSLTKVEVIIAFYNGFLKTYSTKKQLSALNTSKIIEIIKGHYSYEAGIELLIQKYEKLDKFSKLKKDYIPIP